MRNVHAGELDIELGGGTYPAKMTFKAMQKIESALDIDAASLSNALLSGKCPISQLVVCLHETIKAGAGKAPSIDELGEMVLVHGAQNFIEPIGTLLLWGIIGGEALGRGEESTSNPATLSEDSKALQ